MENTEEDSSQCVPSDIYEAARGCVIGAFVGDAAGAVLEFYRKKITQEIVDKALTFPGGGCLRVQPGQITDDSEMAMCLMHGLIESESELDPVKIAKYYLDWYDSNPYDMGITTRRALGEIYDFFKKKEENLDDCYRRIDNNNCKSESNGCLMRATPLSVYCHKLSDSKIRELTKLDVKLTHSNIIAVESVVCYNIAIAHLLNKFGDAEGAIERVNKYIDTLTYPKFKNYWNDAVSAESEDSLISAEESMGHVVIAFSYAFYYLKNNYTYEKAMNNMLLKGGDTDTNAAIVGGLIGARYGINGIPEDWQAAVYNCENERPDFLKPQSKEHMFELIDKIVDISPDE